MNRFTHAPLVLIKALLIGICAWLLLQPAGSVAHAQGVCAPSARNHIQRREDSSGRTITTRCECARVRGKTLCSWKIIRILTPSPTPLPTVPLPALTPTASSSAEMSSSASIPDPDPVVEQAHSGLLDRILLGGCAIVWIALPIAALLWHRQQRQSS